MNTSTLTHFSNNSPLLLGFLGFRSYGVAQADGGRGCGQNSSSVLSSSKQDTQLAQLHRRRHSKATTTSHVNKKFPQQLQKLPSLFSIPNSTFSADWGGFKIAMQCYHISHSFTVCIAKPTFFFCGDFADWGGCRIAMQYFLISMTSPNEASRLWRTTSRTTLGC